MDARLEEEFLRLYREPPVGGTYRNTYGEENIRALVDKCRGLEDAEKRAALDLIESFSRSPDLTACYLSVGVLHGLGRDEAVRAAYAWARERDDATAYLSHFDIGVAIADHFIAGDKRGAR